MCVTTDKDGLGVVFSPGKRELSCVSPRTRIFSRIRSCIFSREEGTVRVWTRMLYFLQGRGNCHVCHHDKDGLGVVFSPGKRELSCVSPRTRMD